LAERPPQTLTVCTKDNVMLRTLMIDKINKKIDGTDFIGQNIKVTGIPDYQSADVKGRELLNKLVKKALRLELQSLAVSVKYAKKDKKGEIVRNEDKSHKLDFGAIQELFSKTTITWKWLVDNIHVEKSLESKRFHQMTADLHKWTGKPLEELQRLTVEELGEKHEKAETLIADLMREQMAKLDI
jgi:hypothetical protein